MPNLSRRSWLTMAGMAAASWKRAGAEAVLPLFDGKTLDGWIQIENSATALSSGGIRDATDFVARLAGGSDAMSVYLREQLDDSLKADLAAYRADSPNAKTVIAALVKALNQILSGASIYESSRIPTGALRADTQQFLRQHPTGQELARLNKLLLEDAYPADLEKSSSTGWTVKDAAMASTGTGRGVIYTARDFRRFRLMFTMRHVSGNPDHQACVLIFCSRPALGEKPLDALGGIQFQVPNGGHWDYRPGMNNAGGAEFTQVRKPGFDAHAWSRVEIVADAGTGTARMAVAQPPGEKAVEVLNFRDPAAGKAGPIAWQMHNAGLFDEYKDVSIDPDPKEDGLISVG